VAFELTISSSQRPLDPRQLTRIENVHRGFLYQHLFTVGCLLLARGGEVHSVQPELDEDIELSLSNRRVYVQVKKRGDDLQCSDIVETLQRFDGIRNAHSSGDRPGEYEFWIATNACPSAGLVDKIRSHQLPADVSFLFRGDDHHRPDYLPPAWRDITEAVEWCTALAEKIPSCKLAGETLVWKLAGLVQFACTGPMQQADHCFLSDQLPTLFEQIAIQLQQFPAPPKLYYPHEREPNFASDSRARLIVGFSGAGKSAWASQAVLHHGSTAAYFDVGDTPSSALASCISRELAARFFSSGQYKIGDVLLPGITGLDSIRALDVALSKIGQSIVVVLDNAHRASPDSLSDIIRATFRISWILLSQPTPTQKELADLLGICEEKLDGWTIETIASALRQEGCEVDPSMADRILRLTGGLPLHVMNLSRLAKKHHGADVGALCDDLESMKYIAKPSQERILSRVCAEISSPARTAMALLSLADVPLAVDEVLHLIHHWAGTNEQERLAGLHELADYGIARALQNQDVILHDAFRILAVDALGGLSSELLAQARRTLADILYKSLPKTHDLGRQRLYLRLLPSIGETKTLIDLASNDAEMFEELGFASETKKVLLGVADSHDAGSDDRFWALDALTYWACQDRDWVTVESNVARMEALLGEFDAQSYEISALAIKKMLLSAAKGDLAAAGAFHSQAYALRKDQPDILRILNYDYAYCLYSSGRYSEAVSEVEALIKEYYSVLGLTLDDVFAKNPRDIWPKIKASPTHHDDLKRLADCLDLYAHAKNRQGLHSGLARIHAFKFYSMATAIESAIRVGQDFVDEQLGMCAPGEAKRFLEETLIPSAKQLKLLDHYMPLRLQYAVVLAYCGEAARAIAEITALKQFTIPNPAHREEFERQCELVHRIIRGEISLAKSYPAGRALIDTPVSDVPDRKIGRNEPCPCGSGKKYKRCHGQVN